MPTIYMHVGSVATMRVLLMLGTSCLAGTLGGCSTLSRESSCGLFTAEVCEETGKSSFDENMAYTRTFPKCCKPTKTDMTFREGVGCLKEDSDFRHSFAQCIKKHFDDSGDYNALKPADAMAKIGPDTIQ